MTIKMKAIDCFYRVIPFDLDDSYDGIMVQVISGDEVITPFNYVSVTVGNKELKKMCLLDKEKTFDSSCSRCRNFYESLYFVEKKDFEDWNKRKKKYETYYESTYEKSATVDGLMEIGAEMLNKIGMVTEDG